MNGCLSLLFRAKKFQNNVRKLFHFPETTQTPQRKTCSDIVCDKASTVSCGETNDGPVCHCKDGYFAGLDKITCHGEDDL